MTTAPPAPFLFPQAHSTVLPDPSLFSPHLQRNPLPTNSFFQNFALHQGDQPEYIHPYLVKSSNSSLSISFPCFLFNASFIYQIFSPDLTISASGNNNPYSGKSHVISSFNDLSVTLDFPSSNLRFFLVRGSPFLTCSVTGGTALSISTIHKILSFTSNHHRTKYTIKLDNKQTWLIYSSSPVDMTHGDCSIASGKFSGIIRIAMLPDSNPKNEAVLDRFSSCYPVYGEAVFTNPFTLEYKWKTKGKCHLLMLTHPLHRRLLSKENRRAKILKDFKYRSIDGKLVGIVGSSWVLKLEPISVTWHSIRGTKNESKSEIISALKKDVKGLNLSSTATSNSYFYGKLISRAARLALIAEEVSFLNVIPHIKKFLKAMIEPWLEGTFQGNGFLYDGKWGGLVTRQGAGDIGADFGFGAYNDHHFHLGYFIYGIAVLAKIDPAWGRKFRPQAYSIMADYMNLGTQSNSKFPRLRNFDPYKLHSWASGLTEFADGRNQESTSEAVNAYYAAALMGLAYGDTHLAATGSTLAALEIHAAQTWWHVREGKKLYGKEFTKENRVVGVLWSTKRDSGLWFAPPESREIRLGIQVLPLLPITEILFSDAGYAKELVEWTLPASQRNGATEEWKGFLYALEGIYNKESALNKIRSLKAFDDGNSRSNLLWWIHSVTEVKVESKQNRKSRAGIAG